MHWYVDKVWRICWQPHDSSSHRFIQSVLCLISLWSLIPLPADMLYNCNVFVARLRQIFLATFREVVLRHRSPQALTSECFIITLTLCLFTSGTESNRLSTHSTFSYSSGTEPEFEVTIRAFIFSACGNNNLHTDLLPPFIRKSYTVTLWDAPWQAAALVYKQNWTFTFSCGAAHVWLCPLR